MAAIGQKRIISMMHFFRVRGHSLAVVVLVMFLIAVLQGGVSYSVEQGPLRIFESTTLWTTFRVFTAGLYAVRIAILLLLATLWSLNRKRVLFRAIIAANAYFTLGLLVDVIALIRVLAGLR